MEEKDKVKEIITLLLGMTVHEASILLDIVKTQILKQAKI